MEHLTDKEIFDFAHIAFYNADAEATVKKVNFHIIRCAQCAAKVALASRYYDAVAKLSEGAVSLKSDFDVTPAEANAAARSVSQTGERQSV